MRRPTSPGDTLADWLEEKKMSQAALCREIKRPLKTINEIIKGKAAITPQTALELESAGIGCAEFWVVREALFRLALYRLESK